MPHGIHEAEGLLHCMQPAIEVQSYLADHFLRLLQNANESQQISLGKESSRQLHDQQGPQQLKCATKS